MYKVSTHSRPKAAGACRVPDARLSLCFNTQPPEGGWSSVKCRLSRGFCFNTQPPEGGWRRPYICSHAGFRFNTQPPEGGWAFVLAHYASRELFQHTAARRRLGRAYRRLPVGLQFQHTAARRRLVNNPLGISAVTKFQHTAARRRLGNYKIAKQLGGLVSTHSRPKAAGPSALLVGHICNGFNTQPPEGGWGRWVKDGLMGFCFNTQPPEGGWIFRRQQDCHCLWFQHTAARRRLEAYQKLIDDLQNVSTHSRPKAAG